MAAIVKLFRYKIRIRVPGDTIDTRTIPNLGRLESQPEL